MKRKKIAPFARFVIVVVFAVFGDETYAGEKTMPYVRWSELEVDPARLDRFVVLASENVQQTRLTEPGVIAFHSAAEQQHPNRIRVLEIYADASAYKAHVETAHFQKFRSATGDMVVSRRLFDATPVMLGAKPDLLPASVTMRIAELAIDPLQFEAYKAAVTEEIDASIRLEPGVYAIYAVALKEQPNHLRFFEIYADQQAYLSHRETPHFKKYVETTRTMITARKLFDAVPVAAASRSR